jgi:hypothetical protein
MFLIDIPFKGCQGRSNRSSIVHAVSYFACGVNDTASKKYINLTKNFRASCTIFAFENRSYLGEFEAGFKKASARESGAKVV